MINGTPIFEAVIHAYNFSLENSATGFSNAFTEANVEFHDLISPDDDYRLTREEFIRDWQIDEIMHVVFVESSVDYAVYQALPLSDFYKDGLVSVDKGAAMAARWPERVRWYGTVNPFEGDAALRSLEHQVTELGASGVKLYPARYEQPKTRVIRLDDAALTFPILEKALELGITSVACHKAQPVGHTSISAFRLDDVDEACATFPDLNFEIVHTGWAFLEDSCLQLARHDNLFANLEVTFNLIVNRPRRFMEILGSLLHWGGPDKILYGSGCNLVHPLPGLNAFLDAEMPADLVEGFQYPELTNETKAKILGGNSARLHGIDLAEKAELNDEISKMRSEWESAGPWAPIRSTHWSLA